MLAAGGSGGRNEIKIFEAPKNSESETIGELEGGFKPTFTITDFQGGVNTSDFSNKSDRLLVGTAGGLVAGFRLKVHHDLILN